MADVSILTLAGDPAEVRPPLSGHVRTASPDSMDRAVNALAVAGVTALTALGWLLSYTALRQLALSAGMVPWAATLWPLCVDLFVFVATLAAISGRRHGRPTTYAWTLAMLYSAGTVAGNVMAAGDNHLAQVVHATPAVTMVLAWHLLSGFFSHGRDRTEGAAGRPEAPDSCNSGETGQPDQGDRGSQLSRAGRPRLEEVAAWVVEYEAAGRRPTGDQVAARFGVSDRTGRRLLSNLRSLAVSGTAG